MYRQEKSLQEKVRERERAQVMIGGVVGEGFWVRGGWGRPRGSETPSPQ